MIFRFHGFFLMFFCRRNYSANYARVTSITMTVTYEAATVWYRTGGQWVQCAVYYRLNGVWVQVAPYYRSGGAWIQV